jgi:hypothetical protein
MSRISGQPHHEVTWSLTPEGPLVLLYVGAVAAAGRFFGGLMAWLVDRLGISKALGISLNYKELRDELEPMCSLVFGSFYLCFWAFVVIGGASAV